ncbi:MAG TPA: hypothetical protein VFG47_08470 [Geminicoccaceae bacterium]|nr:hypothetical protein [Geminicoccaceae bacterium]
MGEPPPAAALALGLEQQGDRVGVHHVEQAARRQVPRDGLAPAPEVAEPADRAVRGEDEVEPLAERQLQHVAPHEPGAVGEPDALGQPPRLRQRGPGEIDAHDQGGALPREAQRVEPEVALEVEEPFAAQVA